MYILAFRSRVSANAPLQVTNPLQVYTDAKAASAAAEASAKASVTTDYFVMEAIEKHSAEVRVNVTKP